MLAVAGFIAGSVHHQWSTSERGQQARFFDDLAAMPGVDGAERGRIDLADDATPAEARAVYEALDRDVPGLDTGGWRMSHGAAELVVSPGFVRTGTDGIDLTTMLGSAGALDDHDVTAEISDTMAEAAQITLAGPDADRLSAATAVIDALAAHPDVVPQRIDLHGGPGTASMSAEALRDPEHVVEDLAAVAEVADLGPWVVLKEEHHAVGVWVDHRRDVGPTRERIRSALADAPDDLEIDVIVSGGA